MNRYRIIDFIRNTEIVKKHDEYLDLLRSPNAREQALMLQQINLKSFLKRLKANPYYAGYLKDISDYDLDSVPYMIDDCETGLLYDSNDDSLQAERIILEVTNQTESIQIINKAKQNLAKYSWKEIRKAIMRVYGNE